MSVNYSAAEELADVVRAFAIIESDEDPSRPGDDGQAYGLLQMHPATFIRYYGCVADRFRPSTADTWTTAEIKACAAFLYAHKWGSESQDRRDLIVQAWNIGEAGVFIDGERNLKYLTDWQRAYAKVTGEAVA